MSSIRTNKFNAAAKLMERATPVKSTTTNLSFTELPPKKNHNKKNKK
jgi:hypothetical protein